MGKGKEPEGGVHTVARNPKAWHQYRILERWEAGLALMGSEVKSLRSGRATIAEGFVHPRGGELWLLDVHIPEYPQASFQNHEPTRPRKLLLHRRQIREICEAIERKGVTAVPLSLYFKNGKAKVEVALAAGKTHADRREDIRKRETEREIRREIGRRR